MNNQTDPWEELHKNYQNRDWIDKPSMFAETAVSYFPKNGKILDLGAGQGQDSRFFAEHGYEVTSTDVEDSALKLSDSKLTEALRDKITLQKIDLREALPFPDESFDVVYAHLSLHYFDTETTIRLFGQISRVLKQGGILAFFVNSTSDPECGSGKMLEKDYFRVGAVGKRFFDVESAKQFAQDFRVQLLDNNGETYKDNDMGVHNLIRFIGNKI